MDPVTISSLLAAAAGALGSEAVKDLYEAAKQAIKDLFGQDEDLLEAFQTRYEEVRRLCRSRGIGFVPISTHEDISTQLTKGLQALGNRRSANHSGVAGVA